MSADKCRKGKETKIAEGDGSLQQRSGGGAEQETECAVCLYFADTDQIS